MSIEISIIIADDHPIFRQGLRQIIEREANVKIIGECENGEAALHMIQQLNPEIAVLDIDMPKMSGLQVLHALKKLRNSTKVIFLTVHRNWESFDEAVNSGAGGYVLKDSAVEDIVKAICAVSVGETYTSSVLNDYFFSEKQSLEQPKQFKIQQLTFAERQVLKLIGEYLTNKQIAEILAVSPMTVKTHRRNIINKFGLEGNNKLIKIALEYKSFL